MLKSKIWRIRNSIVFQIEIVDKNRIGLKLKPYRYRRHVSSVQFRLLCFRADTHNIVNKRIFLLSFARRNLYSLKKKNRSIPTIRPSWRVVVLQHALNLAHLLINNYDARTLFITFWNVRVCRPDGGRDTTVFFFLCDRCFRSARVFGEDDLRSDGACAVGSRENER